MKRARVCSISKQLGLDGVPVHHANSSAPFSVNFT